MNPDSTTSLEVKILPEYYKNLIEVWLNAKEINQTNNLTFYQILKEIISGNRFIKFKNKCIFFKAWMNSNIIYINDLLNTDGIIDQNLIFNKLHNKTNYHIEKHTLLQSIPKHWNTLLKSKKSRKTKVRTTTDTCIYLNGTPLKTINTKLVYKALLKHKSTKPLTNRF